MFNKIIYDPIIIPKIESELDLDEIGLITSMINNIEADYKDAQALSEILGTSINEIYTAAKKLAEKGYLKIINGVYAVNKLKIKDMLLIEPNKNKEG